MEAYKIQMMLMVHHSLENINDKNLTNKCHRVITMETVHKPAVIEQTISNTKTWMVQVFVVVVLENLNSSKKKRYA